MQMRERVMGVDWTWTFEVGAVAVVDKSAAVIW